MGGDGKMSLKHIEMSLSTNIEFKGDYIKHNMYNSIALTVLKETKVDKVGGEGLIDLKKAVYKNFPSKYIKNSNSILLTKKEEFFIKTKVIN